MGYDAVQTGEVPFFQNTYILISTTVQCICQEEEESTFVLPFPFSCGNLRVPVQVMCFIYKAVWKLSHW